MSYKTYNRRGPISQQRFNKRSAKLLAICASVILFITGVHFTATKYSDEYQQISQNVASAISDHIADVASDYYIFEDFTFKGSYPEDVKTPEEILDWNQQLYTQDLKGEMIDEGKEQEVLKYPKYHDQYQKRSDSTLVVQVRNKDLPDLVQTITQIEENFNKDFKYPYVLLNIDSKYNAKFQKTIKELLPGREVFFEFIDLKEINKPTHIDREKEQAGIRKLKTDGLVPAMNIRLLKNLFRYFSYKFYFHPRLLQYKYYWRFEVGTQYFNKIDYDIFQFMATNDKTFGFTIAAYEYDPVTLETILPTTLRFLGEDENMSYLHPNNSASFLMENLIYPQASEVANGYSTCHFWSSFEVGNMEFFRSDTYKKFYDFLDESGGFYYDRWGDGPVHSLALSLFEDSSKLHWFNDIAYEQYPFFNCPESAGDKCEHFKFSHPDFAYLNCAPMWSRFSK